MQNCEVEATASYFPHPFLIILTIMEMCQFPSSDLGDLKRAHEAMKDLSEYINEAKRDREMLQIIEDLQVSFYIIRMITPHSIMHYSLG